jgi:hypothetical protein
MKKSLRATLLAGALGLTVLLSACGGGAVRVGYRSYDPYYSDYHVWGPAEGPYYNQWIIETHRPQRDFRRLRREDQRNYWRWRHDHR